jgi:hypothetical protein
MPPSRDEQQIIATMESIIATDPSRLDSFKQLSPTQSTLPAKRAARQLAMPPDRQSSSSHITQHVIDRHIPTTTITTSQSAEEMAALEIDHNAALPSTTLSLSALSNLAAIGSANGVHVYSFQRPLAPSRVLFQRSTDGAPIAALAWNPNVSHQDIIASSVRLRCRQSVFVVQRRSSDSVTQRTMLSCLYLARLTSSALKVSLCGDPSHRLLFTLQAYVQQQPFSRQF